ncbi:MAG: DsbA family protein [Fusobacteriaceae bacterium]|jgi:predicted DsbA family dithiol-disulfide isomerase|nr:DsbA family protein [Fusobacteriaceae bacterium]
MNKLQIFYDYSCPFCKKGYESFLRVITPFIKDIDIEWIPVESHPRPENVHPHTDLCIQAFYIICELNGDIPAFHHAMYDALVIEKRDVEKSDVLADIVKNIVDPVKFIEILESNKYADKVNQNNDFAYEKSGVWVVPAFRMNNQKLDAIGGIGVTDLQISDFLKLSIN